MRSCVTDRTLRSRGPSDRHHNCKQNEARRMEAYAFLPCNDGRNPSPLPAPAASGRLEHGPRIPALPLDLLDDCEPPHARVCAARDPLPELVYDPQTCPISRADRLSPTDNRGDRSPQLLITLLLGSVGDTASVLVISQEPRPSCVAIVVVMVPPAMLCGAACNDANELSSITTAKQIKIRVI